MARHVTTITFFLLTQLYSQLGTIMFFTQARSGTMGGPVIIGLKVIYSMQGFILPLSRITEPFFFTILVKRLKILCSPCSSLCASEEERLDDQTFLQRGISPTDLCDD